MVWALLAAMWATAMAQQEEGTLSWQPKVGMNLSNLSDADKPIVDLSFGIETEFMCTDNFSLAAGIIVSNQGAKYDGQQSVYSDYTVDLDYVNIPIMANLYVLPGLAVKAGVQPAFRTKAKVKDDSGTIDMDKFYAQYGSVVGQEYEVKKFDLAIPVGISYEYKNIVLDARYNFGLLKIMDAGDAFYNRVFQLTLGYKFCVDL